jgi:hypothetical protein
LLVSWRLYTSGIGLALGLAAIPMTFRRRAPKAAASPRPAGGVKQRGLDRSRRHSLERVALCGVPGEIGEEASLALAVDGHGAAGLARRGGRGPARA